MTVAEVLERAAVILEERGWVHGDGPSNYALNDPMGPRCAWHAIAEAAGFRGGAPLDAYDDRTAQEAKHLVARQVDAMDLINWNDAPSRNASEVVAAIRSTALSLRREAKP